MWKARRRRRHPRTLAALVGAVAIGVGLAWGPGSATAAATKRPSPLAILTSAERATGRATSFSVRGTAVLDHHTLQLNLAMAPASAGGTMTLDGHGAQLRREFLLIYVKGTQGFFTAEGLSHDQAELVSNHWFEIPSSDTSDYADISMLLSPKAILDGLVPPTLGKITSSSRSTLRGKPVYVITGTFEKVVATFYIAASGTPYIARVFEPSHTDGGTIDFTNYGKSVHFAPPTDVIGAQTNGGTAT